MFFCIKSSTESVTVYMKPKESNMRPEKIPLNGRLSEFRQALEEEIDNVSKEGDLEDKILKIWENTYANYVNNSDYIFYKNVINLRCKALLKTIYPNKKFRNYFYKVSLTPKITMELTAKFSEIYKILKEGESYFSL